MGKGKAAGFTHGPTALLFVESVEARRIAANIAKSRVAYQLLEIFWRLGINVRHIAFSTIEMMIDAHC